ncbi:MAG: sugar ABC transporter permease [Spirochaetales bacterium]|nr:sugar ABC transporter permease [Spirochaetales bacterium]
MITYNEDKNKPKRRRDQFRNYQTGVITGSMKVRNRISNGVTYLILIVLNIIALTPLVYLVGQSFRAESGAWSSTFFPKTWTFANYKRLFTETPFLRWYGNTFFVAVISCLITTAFVLAVSYAFSRIRFKMRKPMMNVMLVLGMFPGFMSMTAVYFLLKILLPNHFQSLASLIIVYSAGAALSYYVAKGFFDTVPKSLDEAAFIDGANRAQIFWKITIPLSKPIVIYTVLISFIAPWCDFIFVSFIMSGVPDVGMYTVSLGMYKWLEREQIQQYFTTFCAAATIVAIPITALFIWLQKYYVEGITGGAVKG